MQMYYPMENFGIKDVCRWVLGYFVLLPNFHILLPARISVAHFVSPGGAFGRPWTNFQQRSSPIELRLLKVPTAQYLRLFSCRPIHINIALLLLDAFMLVFVIMKIFIRQNTR